MKVFIAYKFANEDPVQIKDNLTKVAEYLENSGVETFEYFRDIQKWEPPTQSNKEIIELAFEKLAGCDALVAVVSAKDKSGGMLLEAGYAKALDKKVYLLIYEEVKQDVDRFLFSLADKVIYYHKINDLQQTFQDLF